jgi:hypothetical protein
MWTKEPALLEMLHDWDDRLTLFNREEFYGGFDNFDGRIYALPYTRSLVGLNERLQKLDSNPEKDIFIGHEYTIGRRFGKYVVERGLDIEVLSKKFYISLLGHNHNRARLKHDVYCIGAPIQHNFGDVHQSRGWWIFDTEEKEKSVMSFIENDFSPRFWKIKTSPENEPVELPGNPEKDYYWVTVKGSELPERFKPVRWKRVNFELENTMKDRIDMKLSDSTDDIIEKYVNAQNTDLDKKKLIELGRKYL